MIYSQNKKSLQPYKINLEKFIELLFKLITAHLEEFKGFKFHWKLDKSGYISIVNS